MKSSFEQAVALYREWNGKINVVSRKDIDALYEHHILHSLAIGEYHPFAPGETVLDVGTGGGFPGIPLAIRFPQTQFTLCDSIGKKIKVAQAVADALGLDNVVCVNARAESLPGCYDYVVSRAVTTLVNFYPWVKDKFRRNIFYLKGGDVNAEIAELMRRYGLPKGSVHTWRVDSWLSDEYFSEKFVIDIEKNYLCSPKSEEK
ncbi:MAG: 16S rRNA (guanine(527)-N(7))-methyltransferase RsmG [Bacteroidales bacterium]|nr:16S rRNA (guanine(527)-N(7))-methyltransferase RsmG [Bacteroidales bacterium]